MEGKQSVSQKIPISAIRHKLGISELWSREVWEPTLKGPNRIRGKAPENFGYLTLIRLYNQFKMNVCNVNIFSK